MDKQLKEIEIPFGAKDSELCDWECTIPEGMEATIVDNKIVVKKKNSADERIINNIKKAVESYWSDEPLHEILDWFEKQGQTFTKKDVDDAYLKGVCDTKQELEKQGEQKPAWNKEDEDYYDAIIVKLEVTQDAALLTDNQMEFLKSLKERYTWKPNDKQIKALEYFIRSVGESGYASAYNNNNIKLLYSLLFQLKTLK